MTIELQGVAAYRVLGTSFCVVSDNADLLHLLDDLYMHGAVGAAAEHVIEIVSEPEGLCLAVNSVVQIRGVAQAALLGRFVWEINRLVRSTPTAALLVHGAMVEIGGRGVMLCGASGSGKSTLALALVERGARYLSDEIAAIDDVAMSVSAYPKPITLRPDSWEFVNSLAPNCASEVAGFMRDLWFLTPNLIVDHADVALIVLPNQLVGMGESVTEIGGDAALVALCENTHGMSEGGVAVFRRLARVARQCPAMQASVRSLFEACDAIEHRVGLL